MRPTDQVKVVFRQEFDDDLLSEAVRDSPLVLFPIRLHIRRIRPKEIIEQSIIGNIGGPGDLPDIVHVLKAGGKAAMNAKDLSGNDRGDGERVEGVNERLPDLDVASALALVVESVDYQRSEHA